VTVTEEEGEEFHTKITEKTKTQRGEEGDRYLTLCSLCEILGE